MPIRLENPNGTGRVLAAGGHFRFSLARRPEADETGREVDDGSFDLDFWQAVGAEGRVAGRSQRQEVRGPRAKLSMSRPSRRPAARWCQPAQAIMAALSVQ